MPSTIAHRPARDRSREDLYALIREHHAISRAELTELTGMPRSTVNHAINRLMSDGLVVEVETERKGPGSGSGRPATLLSALPSAGQVAAIDFGHAHVTVAVADSLGHEMASQRRVVDVDLEALAAMDVAAEMLAELEHETLGAIVAGIPGPIDSRSGLVTSPTILSSWVGISPAQELEARLGQRVHVENDAVLGAYGELRRGAGRHFKDFLYIKASHGIGAAIVFAGTMYKGSTGMAGEIGHTRLPGRTELCRCGGRGCLEAVVSVRGVREQLIHSHPGLSADVDLATLEDPISVRVLSEAGRTLGDVLADLSNMFNPAALIIGGELGAAGPALIDGVASSIERHAQPAAAAALEVCPAQLGTRAEITGGLLLATTWSTR